ncbi:MAG: DAK2 domain-containing protein [Lachnospiraceae bacterium]|nr:DAK2 domain-containing protein [Lachnospiraceae bacterium]
MTNQIDAQALKKYFLAGAERINLQKDYINELNVFPVPDGDTGTNMSMTISSAAKAVEEIEDLSIKTVCRAISNGSLRGARGNSGVILSQLFRGFTRSISKKTSLDKADLADGFERAVETAYKAVMKPKEGTILTVAKGVSDIATELADTDLSLTEFCEKVVAHGYEVLAKTPDMLPVLKEAGVVDSGGQGLMEVLQGACDAMTGKKTPLFVPEGGTAASRASEEDVEPESVAEIKYGYCTEFIILLDEPMSEETVEGFKEYLLSIGDSLVCVADDKICKVHVHTNHPGQAFEKALTFGQLTNMKVDNMRLEHEEKLQKDLTRKEEALEEEAKKAEEEKKAKEPPKELGFVTVAAGDGFEEIFKGLGVDYVISGGQTMNPSAGDFLEAIEKVNAKNIVLLPNNGNIIFAAEQAKELETEKNIIVLKTKTVPQGIAAMIGYMPENSVEDNVDSMQDGFADIASGEVTYAVRDTSIDGKEIHQNDIMGIDDDGIKAVGTDLVETTVDLVSQMADEDSEIVSLYYGAEIKEDQAKELAEAIEAKLPDLEVEINYGGQPVYYYMISVE